jgi:glycosyltransferase involved in cell wall biosynthesis
MKAGTIVILNDTLTARGGASGLALEAARGLRERGRSVAFVVGDGTSDEDLVRRGIEITQIKSGRLTAGAGTGALLHAAYNRRTCQVLANVVERYDAPDTIYYVHSWTKSLSASLFEALAGSRGVVVVHAHDFFLACPNGAFFDYQHRVVCERKALSLACIGTQCDKRGAIHKTYRLARHAILRFALDRSRRPWLIAIHKAMVPFFLRDGFSADAIRSINNPSDALCEPVEAERGRGFLFIGRLEKEKGPDLLCAAARRAGVALTLVGQGSMSEALKAAYPEFEFPGWQDKTALVVHARGARALVMPSRYPEPFGLVATEALGAGLPVIASRDAFLADDLARMGCGVSVNPFDEAAFSDLLSELDRDDSRIRAMSRAALQAHRQLSPTRADWLSAIESVFDEAVTARLQSRSGEFRVSA